MLHGLITNESQVSQIQKTYHDLGFNVLESNCHFDPWPFFYHLTFSFKVQMNKWGYYWYLQMFKTFSIIY
jgi:hypothetical protein